MPLTPQAVRTQSAVEDWVKEVYRAVAGRPPDPNGLKYWTAAIQSGIYTRGSFYQAFLRTPEGSKALRKKIEDEYVNTMGRQPDQGGVDYWLSQILDGKIGPEPKHITQAFKASPEYAKRQNISTGTGVTSGTTPTGTGGPQGTLPPNNGYATPEMRNVAAEIQVVLEHYGLGSLFPWADELLRRGEVTKAELEIQLHQRQEFKDRFPALERMATKIKPDEYIRLEREMRQVLRAAGMPEGFYDDLSDFTELIAADVSIAELGARVQQGFQRVSSAPPQVRARFAQMFGAGGDIALAAMFLDPGKATDILQEQVATAEIAGFSDIYGVGIGQATASQLAEMGFEGRTAASGFQNVAGRDNLFQESITETEDLTAEQGVQAEFGLDNEVADTIERRRLGRIGAVTGGGGAAISQTGIAGRTDS